jgi:hypothetical protein
MSDSILVCLLGLGRAQPKSMAAIICPLVPTSSVEEECLERSQHTYDTDAFL